MMVCQYAKFLLLFFACALCLTPVGAITTQAEESQNEVALRMIGHQVLLNFGDSTSRVLPITKEEGRYRIRFDSEFGFMPGKLVQTIDSVIAMTGMAADYLVEVEQCGTCDVVYSYQVSQSYNSDVIPCFSRVQDKACYSLLITILSPNSLIAASDDNTGTAIGGMVQKSQALILLVIPILLIMGWLIPIWKQKRDRNNDNDIFPIGAFQFDKRNMKLSLADDRIELSSKEADLLELLRTNANTTLERDYILNVVWGDKGDYVGRTLDVFISKLRKKLQGDPSVRIANIRGVGYKFVLENS